MWLVSVFRNVSCTKQVLAAFASFRTEHPDVILGHGQCGRRATLHAVSAIVDSRTIEQVVLSRASLRSSRCSRRSTTACQVLWKACLRAKRVRWQRLPKIVP